MKKKFKLGTVIVFDKEGFNPEYWANLSEDDRIKYYGCLGYGQKELKLFVFLTEIKNSPGHCVLVDMQDGHIEMMRHTEDFREATENEV